MRVIKGDITLPKFGIAQHDMDELAKEVSIVFNSAATIRFVEPIDVAVRNNIYSVSQLVEFCNGLNNLKALIHLSTAYSNCHKRDTIYEIFYEPPISGDQIINAVNTLKRIQTELCPLNPSAVGGCNNAIVGSLNGINDNSAMNGLNGDDDDQQQYRHRQEKVLADSDGNSDSSSSSKVKLTSTNYSRGACESQIFYGRDGNRLNAQKSATNLLDEFAQIALERSNRPNTYTFTKAISESYLLDLVKRQPDRYLNDKIPVVVVRPSIVGGAKREPEVGFVDNFNGPTGAILSLYMGALQAMPGKGERVADLVPVDMVVNLVVCAAWFACASPLKLPLVSSSSGGGGGGGKNGPNQKTFVNSDQGAYIFNFVSGFRNPLHWNQVTCLIAKLAYKYPVKQLFRLPGSYFVRAGTLYNVYDAINHKLPAKLHDFVSSVILRRQLNPRSSVLASYQRIKQMTDTLTPFTSNQWRLSDANVCALNNQLDRADKSLFEFDVATINWTEYITNYIIGSRIYTLRDEARNVPKALANLRK